jgi:hypothetical protein
VQTSYSYQYVLPTEHGSVTCGKTSGDKLRQ